jgi:hypothetical protein
MLLDYEVKTSDYTKLDELNELLEMHSLSTNITGSVEIDDIKVQSRFVEITPSLAKEIITKYQRNNRRLSPENLNFITKQMVEGTFKFNGESIVFNEDGGLDDGNHRMHSIVNSGKTYVFTVISGLSKEAFMTMGTGKKRTGNDVFEIMKVPSASLASSSTRFIYLFRKGKYRKGANSVASLSNQELYEYYLNLDNFDEWVKLGNRYYKQSEMLVTGTLFVGFSYILNKINPVKSAEFMDKLSSGADLGKLSPILALRNKIIKARDSKNFHMEYSEIIKTIFYAWEKYLNNENVKVLKLPENYEINLQTSLLV